MSRAASDMFTTIRSEGGLLPPALLARVATSDPDLPGGDAASYHLVSGERFGEAISRSWARLLGAWRSFRATPVSEGDLATSTTREKWLLPLFAELGYGRLQTTRAIDIGDKSYPVSHLWAAVPIHLVGAGVSISDRSPGVRGAAGASPHAMVQELLNRSPEHLWAFVSNGLRLRVLRDNVTLTRQAFVEFDLEAMMNGEVYADFAVLWLLCHESRVEADPITECWLEQWTTEARTQGTRALDHLRDGVEAAIERLGAGFLAQPANQELRRRLSTGDLTAKGYYRELLRLVYRILFLLVAEERNVLLDPGADIEARSTYEQYYAVRRLRDLAERRRGTPHHDLWEQLRIVFAALARDGQPALGLPALGSELFAPSEPLTIDDSTITNRDLLVALRHLSGRDDDKRKYRWRFDYRNLGAEELGSVYEALLELEPEVNVSAATFTLLDTGSERRDTGSHYTPTPILKRVLDFALEPHINRCLTAPDPEAALLDLRLLDPACGSGHFLVAAGHRIARAVAAVRTGEAEPDPAEVRRALRDVTAVCLYGVDYNPMAVELCRVALWLETLEPGKPLSFLDHHIRCGNSLIGVPAGATVARNRAAVDKRRTALTEAVEDTKRAVDAGATSDERDAAAKEVIRLRRELRTCVYDSWADAIPDDAFKAIGNDDKPTARKAQTANRKGRASGQLKMGFGPTQLELPSELVEHFKELSAGAEDTLAEVTIRAARYDEATRTLAYRHATQLADTWTAAWFWPLQAGGPAPPTQEIFATLRVDPGTLDADVQSLVEREASERRFLHFELAFPDVFSADRGGFDLVLGNPPYLGGMKISTTYGDKVLHFLKGNHPAQTGGRIDLAAYFVRRGFDLLRPDGDLCFITTNTIAQGDTRDAALVPMSGWGATIADAVTSEPWEGRATVSVAILHLRRGILHRKPTLDGEEVDHISPSLTSGGENAEAVALPGNTDMVSVGTNVLGEGFWIDADTRDRLLRDDPRNAEVIKPFIGGRQAMQSPDPAVINRWVIDFGDRTLDQAETYTAPMEIVRTKVKPQREEIKRKRYRDYWWQLGERSVRLYEQIASKGLSRVIAIPTVSKTMLPVFLPADAVFQDALFVFISEESGLFGLLSSSFHWLWAAKHCTTMRTDPRYNPGRIFASLPLPSLSQLSEPAEVLLVARATAMTSREVGMTRLYNLVFDPDCDEPDIKDIRERHAELDHAVARAYGWDDLVPRLVHGFHETRFGVRWTVPPDVQREIEDRLLGRNLEQAAAVTHAAPR